MSRTIQIDDATVAYIEEKIAEGLYESFDDAALYAFDLLREDDAAKLQWLREAVREGMESGIAGPFDMEKIKQEARQRRTEA
jgi:putative addiction module CopG family antidote